MNTDQDHHAEANPPFGYRFADESTELEEDPREQKVLAMVDQLRESGLSYRAIERELEVAAARQRLGPEVCLRLDRYLMVQKKSLTPHPAPIPLD